ncbi:MAG: serine acetyltransferase, partial [Lachnospiraceae bacterium]|nr:serine acetyltransferase [Lachnospiraceae bacterium]
KDHTNKFFIAFGDMKKRKKLYEYYVSKGWEAVNIIHPDAVVSDEAKIGKGVLIECGCLITPNPIIGNNVVVNTGSQINHDNIIEDHVYIASGVILSGGVTIKENTLLDDGVIVTLGHTVEKNCLIGAGTVVAKDIPESKVACGNPARILRDNEQ